MIDETLADLATSFWDRDGSADAFPRDVETALWAVVGINVVGMANLCTEGVKIWLQSRGTPLHLHTRKRRLNACLFACDGKATIFVHESLPPDVRRVALAHELGHFLDQYEGPRQRMLRRLGPGMLSVLDGKRSPSPVDELATVLAGVRPGAYVHFMDREADGGYTAPVSEAERIADELALELLAPWRVVFSLMRRQHPWPVRVEDWEHTLRRQFGLPAAWARQYAARLLAGARGQLTFSEAIGL